MKQFFDTSVLVSAFVEDERCHEVCADAVSGASDGHVYVHALAECFAVLTSGRLSVQIRPLDAAAMIEANIMDRMKIVTLTPREAMRVITDCHRLGVRGGGVYDALHLAAARKVEADQIMTLNVRHFMAFAPDLAGRIRKP